MRRRPEPLPVCESCGGTLFPLILCEACGAATILRTTHKLDWAAPCAECGRLGPWQLLCDRCHSRFPAPGTAKDPSVPPREVASPTPAAEPATSPTARRASRRIKGEVDRRAIADVLKVLGLDASRSTALIERGYDAAWKIGRATEAELARIPEVGPVAARKVVASFRLLNYAPPPRTKESFAREEHECPLCHCITSAFATTCVDCGAAFDEVEMEETIRQEFAEAGDAGLLAFYDARLAERPEDPDLLYARGLLLDSLDRVDEAIEALDRAAAKAPDVKKIKVALLRAQAGRSRAPDPARVRTTARALVDDVAWDVEVTELDHLIGESEPTCPNCNAGVSKDATECPLCRAPLKPASVAPPTSPPPAPPPPKEAASPELDALVDDLLVGELEESLTDDELERTKAAVVDWLIAELEESLAPDDRVLLPPEPGAEIEEAPKPRPASPTEGFLSGWIRGSRGLVSGARPKGGPRAGGKVNGLVNGRGRVNGLVNGLGRVNGLATPTGRVNGLVLPRGRVNGLTGGPGRINGMVNGTPFARRTARGLKFPYPSRRIRFVATVSSILVAVLIAGLLFVPIPGPAPPIAIDGSFGDWASVPMFDAATAASDPNVSISRYAGFVDADTLYLFAATRAAMFGDAVSYDGLYFLIDGDGDPSTGYSFDGLGAEAVLETFGGDSRLEATRLYSFPAGSEVNWSRRQPGGQARAAASVDGLEATVSTLDIDAFDVTRFRIGVYADDFRGASSRSHAFLNPAGAAVLLEVHPLTSLVGPSPAHVFDVRLRGLGLSPAASILVSNLTFSTTPGVTVSLSPEFATLTQGRPNATLAAFVSAPGFFPGDAIQVNLTGADAPYPVSVRGGPVRAYAISVPGSVRIDGLFADWNGRDLDDTDPAPVNNSNVDVARYGAVVNATSAYFHVSVAGQLLGGRVPERFVRSVPGVGGNATGPPIPLPRRTGEDILQVYIDVNATDASGGPVEGVLADFLFEVRGVSGRVRTQSLFAWNASWVPVVLPTVALEKNETDIEGSLAIGSLTNRTRLVFAMTDWSGISDLTPPANASVQAPLPAPGRIGPVVNAPEFSDVAVPIAATLIVVLSFARRRRRSA